MITRMFYWFVAILVLGSVAHASERVVSPQKEKLNHHLKSKVSEDMLRQVFKEQIKKRYNALNVLSKKTSVKTSILSGLSINVAVKQTAHDKCDLIIEYRKDSNDEYVVDSIEETTILYVNNRPWQILRRTLRSKDVREPIGKTTAVASYTFTIKKVFSSGDNLFIEWCNYNPRTKEIERLRSASVVFDGEN